MCQEFARDAFEARKKYEGGSFALSGKAMLPKNEKELALTLYADDSGEQQVVCQFEMSTKLFKAQVVDRVQSGQEVTVEGRCSFQQRAGKGTIVMEECILREGS
jgi:hypothetical protein